MSIRRKIGDIVRKRENAGFIGEALIIKIVDLDPERSETNDLYLGWCFLDCGDTQCREWSNCEIIIDGKSTGDYCCHVSECEMEDL